MSIDAIFLDIGGIIVEIDWQKTLIPLGFHDEASQNKVIDKIREWEHHHEFERGNIAESDFFWGLKDLLKLDLHQTHIADAWNKLIAGPLPGVEKIFDTYSGKVPIFALSNTNITHHEYLNQNFPIFSRFDRVYTSYELRERKPDLEIFWEVARVSGIDPRRSIFIDDSIQNVESARKVGFHSYQTINSPVKTLEVLAQHF